MDKIVYEIRSRFLSELESQGDLWRIYRKSTFVDLIVRDFVSFNISSDPNLLINIFNYVIKMRMIEKLKKLELDQDLDTLSKTFGKNNTEIIQLYDATLSSVSSGLDGASLIDLDSNVLYLKVASNLNLDEYNESVFDELLSTFIRICRDIFDD